MLLSVICINEVYQLKTHRPSPVMLSLYRQITSSAVRLFLLRGAAQGNNYLSVGRRQLPAANHCWVGRPLVVATNIVLPSFERGLVQLVLITHHLCLQPAASLLSHLIGNQPEVGSSDKEREFSVHQTLKLCDHKPFIFNSTFICH